MPEVSIPCIAPVPINDIAEVMEHMNKVWGVYDESNTDRLGGVRKTEIPKLASDWVLFLQQTIAGTLTYSYQIYVEHDEPIDDGGIKVAQVVEALRGEDADRDYLDNAKRAFRAFSGLANPDLLKQVRHGDVQVVERVIQQLDAFYHVQGLLGMCPDEEDN